jgi:hypothetical protein
MRRYLATNSHRYSAAICVLTITSLAISADWSTITRHSGWKQHSMRRPKPPVVTPADAPGKPPADAVVLFDGKSLDAFASQGGGPAKWTLGDGWFEVKPGSGPIVTKAAFGDVQLHIEWASPSPAVGKSQDRGNSGVFLMNQFEIQVLDNFEAETYADGQAGAIYGQYPPLANASRPPGEWQAYDIAFRRPRFDAAGKLTEPARMTVIHNGIVVQNNEVIYGPTSWLRYDPYSKGPDKAPIELQDHGHTVKFRNFWVRELPERAEADAVETAPIAVVPIPAEKLASYAGEFALNTRPNSPPLVVRAMGDHLLARFPNRVTEMKLLPIGDGMFQFSETDARFEFSPDGKSLKFRIGGDTRTISRRE